MERLPHLVVGIGAAMRYPNALRDFLAHLPADNGVAIVLLASTDPEDGALADIVRDMTDIPVEIAQDGTRLNPGVIHVAAEGEGLVVADARLRRSAPSGADHVTTLALFFASLARDQQDNAVGIVLAGVASEATAGLEKIKAHGGVTFAQIVETDAERGDADPSIDVVLPAADIAQTVLRLARMADLQIDPRARDVADVSDEALRFQYDISAVIRDARGHDFSGYKNESFVRRVARRMRIRNIPAFGDYVDALKNDSAEIDALFNDLMINVTAFFRDPEAFAALERTVIPSLLEGRGAQDTVRIWVAGCSTGEEVYSIAILVREALERSGQRPRVQIFGTDIDETVLEIARAGQYPDTATGNIAPKRLERFFRREGAYLAIVQEVRDMCIFSPHSVVADPPFSRMDLVSCRNLMIYLGNTLQDRIIPTFHYALRDGGYLFVGASEGISRHAALFSTVDKSARIYRSLGNKGKLRRFDLVFDRFGSRPVTGEGGSGSAASGGNELRQIAEAQILERHAPAHVLANRDGHVVHVSSNTGRYLGLPKGAPSHNLVDLARRELRVDLRVAFHEAVNTGDAETRRVHLFEGDGTGSVVTVTVEPLNAGRVPEQLYLVVFSSADLVPPSGDEAANGAAARKIDATMERELRNIRERLQSTIEEYETAIEELRSANEELISVNEEAQSTNEELEASKEEMQSLNEELTTINLELTANVEELDRTNNDLRNLYSATDIATVFLDEEMIVRNYTPAAGSFFRLRHQDLGRPLTDFSASLQVPELETHIRQILATGAARECRIETDGRKRHHLVRFVPYRHQDGTIGGVVIAIVDVTTLALAEAHQRVLIAELNHRVRNMLGVVASIAVNSEASFTDVGAFTARLTERIHAMARAYTLLSDADWTQVNLDDLVGIEAAVFGTDRFRLRGPEIALSPEEALPLAIVFHEAATNAAKYGALSRPGGHVSMTWSIEGDTLRVAWHERGGPETTEPETTGFGLDLIGMQIASLRDGHLDLAFKPDGVSLEFGFSLHWA